MRLSVCPDCYKDGKVVEGRFLNTVTHNIVYVQSMYWCDKCKKSYSEK